MGNKSTKIHTIVEYCVSHQWSIPEFQRGFVWKSTQVRDLAESLWMDYPIGSLLLWDSTEGEVRTARDGQQPGLWLVDGQQRATALCVLFARKPYWWDSSESWDQYLKRYDIRFDVNATEPPYFWVASAPIRKSKNERYVPLYKLLQLDTSKEADRKTLTDLAKKIKEQDLCQGKDAMEVYSMLDRVRGIRDRDIVIIDINHELEDVVEIFSRLNSRGTRVTEADIYLGIVAGKTKGWVRDTFLPFHSGLKDIGFDLNPNLLFRCLVAIGAQKGRFKEVPDSFWDSKEIAAAWKRTSEAWRDLVKRLKEHGILSNRPMPTQAALVTLLVLMEKYPKENFKWAMYWFLQASRLGRYSGSGSTGLSEDIKDIGESINYKEAIHSLLKRLQDIKDFTSEDFLKDYSDSRIGTFLLYLLVYKNGAQDWDEKGFRLGFDGQEFLAGFRPQWHHIFPQKFLENAGVADEKIQALANIAVIGEKINIRISANAPMKYLDKYSISDEKLSQQFIDPVIRKIETNGYDKWLSGRAEKLASEANSFLGELRKGL